MTQLQFDMICKIIQNGAPVLANELCNSLTHLVVDYNKMAEELDSLKEQCETCGEDSKDENPN